MELAVERVFGELSDLQAGDLLPPEVDPFEVIEQLQRRYARLWDELTREEMLQPDDQRYRIAERLRRLNDLGFDVDEVELLGSPEGTRLRVRTKVAESGQQSRQLFRQTGIDAEENQARRLLNDIASFRGYLEQQKGRPVSETVAAHRWLDEVYDPVVAAIPAGLRGRLSPPRSSTRSSSTAGTCPRRPAATSAPPPRRARTSTRCCPPCRSRCPRPPSSTSWPWPRAQPAAASPSGGAPTTGQGLGDRLARPHARRSRTACWSRRRAVGPTAVTASSSSHSPAGSRCSMTFTFTLMNRYWPGSSTADSPLPESAHQQRPAHRGHLLAGQQRDDRPQPGRRRARLGRGRRPTYRQSIAGP